MASLQPSQLTSAFWVPSVVFSVKRRSALNEPELILTLAGYNSAMTCTGPPVFPLLLLGVWTQTLAPKEEKMGH